MVDRLRELKILVYQTCEDIYRKSDDNKLSEDEYLYFMSSIAHELILSIYRDNEKKLRGADMRGAESHLDNTPTVAINKDFYKTDKSNPINRSDLFQ